MRENNSKNKFDSQSICPVTGLPVRQFSEFTKVDFGTDYYKDTLTLIGKNIILSKPQGNGTLYTTKKQIESVEKFVENFIPADEQYIMLEDYSDFTGVSAKAKNYFIEYHKKNKRVKYVVFLKTSIYMKIMIKIGKRLNQVKFPVEIVNDYKSAILLATGKTSIQDTDKSKNSIENNKDRTNYEEVLKETNNLCPVSGLHITAKPEWTDIDLEENYSVSFKLIGERILLSIPVGDSGKNGMNRLFEERDKVLKNIGLLDDKYVEIKDYSQIPGATSKEGRQQFTNHMIKERNKSNLLGYFGFSATLFVKLAINIGIKLYRTTFPMQILDDYETAIKKSIDVLEKEKHKKNSLISINDKENSLEFFKSKTSQQNQINNLLAFMGEINWDTNGIEIKKDQAVISSEFSPLYESISLIKQDFDSILYQKVEAEKKLKKSEKKYRSILEDIDDGYYEVDLEGDLIFFNDALCNIYGYSREELLGMNYKEYTDKKNSKKVQNFFNTIYKKETSGQAFDWEFIQKDGNMIPVETSVSLIKDNDDISIGFRGMVRNITERIQSEKKQNEISKELEITNIELEHAVERSNQMVSESAMAYLELDQIFQASAEGMWVISRSYEIIRVNKMFLNIINETHKGIKGKKCYEIFPTHLCHTKKCPLLKIINDNHIHIELDLEVKTKDNPSNPFILSAYPYKNVGNETIGAVVVLKDITERKKAEVFEAEKIKAEAENLSKSEFLANMSHEMRTPLNGIIGMTELIQETNLEDKQKNIFDTIVNEAKALVGIINDVLDFSKIEAGKFELENIGFNLRHLIEDVSNNIAMRAQQKGLEFISYFSPDIPSRISGDPGRLRQILMNLAGNSLKFTHTGEIFIKADMQKDFKDKLRIHFFVKDTGIGIPDDKQETIFNSFTQADGSTTREYGGTGLGTAISKQLVQLMGGEIGLISEEGKGSTFWFTVDFLKEKEEHNVQEPKNLDLNNLNVLIVDQNRNNRYVQMQYLKSWGCHSVQAKDENQALSFIEESISSNKLFDLIIIDSLLSGTTAFKLAGQIRKIESLKKVPIILMTTVGWIGDSKECKKLEINGYLTKPVKWHELQKTIKLVLGYSVENENQKPLPLVTKHTIAEANRENVQILLVEDYPTNQKVALTHLNEAGYYVVLAENGEKAVNEYKQNRYDMILMDIQMPVMGGFEATRIIRDIETGSNKADAESIPIIAMTAHAMGDYKKLCLEAGMDDYISKPLLRKDLLTIVNKWSPKYSENEIPVIGFDHKELLDK